MQSNSLRDPAEWSYRTPVSSLRCAAKTSGTGIVSPLLAAASLIVVGTVMASRVSANDKVDPATQKPSVALETTQGAKSEPARNPVDELPPNAGGEDVTVPADEHDTRYTLHFVGLACDQYDDADWPDLQYPVADTKAVLHALQQHEGKRGFYDLGETEMLFNEGITRGGLNSLVAKIRRGVSRNGQRDVLLVYLSGQSTVVDGEYYFIPSKTPNTVDQIRQRGISWSQLQRLRRSLNCHVLWMFDTNGSGVLAESQSASQPGAKRFDLMVAAAGANEDAFEGESFRDNDGHSHSAFAACLLRGLDGEADGSTGGGDDGIVSVGELLKFVREETYKSTGRNQEPVVGPEHSPLLDLSLISLGQLLPPQIPDPSFFPSRPTPAVPPELETAPNMIGD